MKTDQIGDLFYITLPYATFGVFVRQGRVVHAPPIGKWMVGRLWDEVALWIEGKHGQSEKVT